jgi:hypothetical protein
MSSTRCFVLINYRRLLPRHARGRLKPFITVAEIAALLLLRFVVLAALRHKLLLLRSELGTFRSAPCGTVGAAFSAGRVHACEVEEEEDDGGRSAMDGGCRGTRKRTRDGEAAGVFVAARFAICERRMISLGKKRETREERTNKGRRDQRSTSQCRKPCP